ncbi:hypothetical protein IWQ62_006865, partial [Dispira parvispora]
PIASTKDGIVHEVMCRGPRGKSNGVLKAGETLSLQFDSAGAVHEGGHCEVSMSTNEKDWAVIRTKLTSCFVDEEALNIKVTIPKEAPSLENVVIAWTWVNAAGNREFYMNCMDYSLEGVEGGKIEGPQMVIANYPGYPTIGEFRHSADPRLDLYQNRPMVVITGDGSSAGGNQTESVTDAPTTTAGETASATPTDGGSNPTDTPTDLPGPSPTGDEPAPGASTSTGSDSTPTNQPGKCKPKTQ